jgi:hypothetical protein
MLLVSTGFKALILGRHSFADIFNGGVMHIYSGARPLTADAPTPEAYRCGTIDRLQFDGGLQFAQTGAFIGIPLGHLWGLQPSAPALATWFRLVAPGDTNSANFVEARIDGDVGTLAAPKELVLQDPQLTPGTVTPIDSFLFTLPPL